LSQRERMYHQDKRAHVTFARAVIDGQAYRIADITAVRVRVEQPGILRPALIAGLVLLLGLAGRLSSQDMVCMVFFALSTMVTAIGMPLIMLDKAKYVVLLDGADGEMPILSSTDRAVVEEIANVIRFAVMLQKHQAAETSAAPSLRFLSDKGMCCGRGL
jgi:hypothetical protein